MISMMRQVSKTVTGKEIAILVGAPGTGKTHLAGELVAAVLVHDPNASFALVARIHSSIESLIQNVDRALATQGISKDSVNIISGTIASVGGWGQNNEARGKKYVVVDDAQNVDEVTMVTLLDRLVADGLWMVGLQPMS